MASYPTNAYAQQNGGAVTSPYIRPQFRRQGSSYGPGQVHHMAVIVAPNRVDYSVTKGGLRLWAVLFIFILLCTGMLTIFSDTSDDQTDIIRDIHIEDESEKVENIKPVENPSPDIDEDERDDEEILFATLREKAAKRRRQTEIMKPAETVVQSESEDKPKERKRKVQKRVQEDVIPQKEEREDEEVEAHEKEPEEEIPRKAKRKAPVKVPIEKEVGKRKERRVKVQPEVEEKDDEDEAKEEEEEEQKIQEEKEPEKLPEQEPEELSQVPQSQPKKKLKTRPKFKQALMSNPKEDGTKTPRKNLLKTQKKKPQPIVELDDDDEDEEPEEDKENEEEEKQPVREIVSIHKRTGYNRKAITNREDYKYRARLDRADYLVEKHDFDTALKTYDQVLSSYRNSPRARFGRARVMQLRSEYEQEDHFLDQALAEYQLVLDNDDTTEALFRLSAENLIEAARYRGNLHKVVTVQRSLIDKFPEDISLQNDFGLTFLMMGRPDDARRIFENVLETDPNNSLALAYYGYILKVYDKQTEKGVLAMRRGLRLNGNEIRDSKFYFHLGDGLMRLGRQQEAYRVYEEAAELGLFPSAYQRSTYNLEGLTARPWWNLEQTSCMRFLRHIERQWTIIREEALELWNDRQILFEPEDTHLTDGHQSAFYFMKNGEFDQRNCELAANTCGILKNFVAEANCDRGEMKISVVKSGSRVWPHCGPTNFVLEAQLGLSFPSEARIRVGKDTRGWKTGRFIIFDESFEHEVWFDGPTGNNHRIVLSVELWHPEVPLSSRTEHIVPEK